MNKYLLALIAPIILHSSFSYAQKPPNVVFIYADDLGYGDLSCYGATKIKTPHIDQLAAEGIRFTNGHSSASTCTPSRYSLMTGQYAWRKSGTGILPGDAALIIPTQATTLPSLFRSAGYATGIVGKWHLGLGREIRKNWNAEITPGPNETGFDYSFIFPATADRVPTVFLENHSVVGLDRSDPIEVNYSKKVGNEPTGREHPELLKLKATPGNGHDQTIVNGIGRIGYMTGGKTARWADEELSFTFLDKANAFIAGHKEEPFFLYFAATEPHVPRMPATIFKGKSGLGFRGDAILQLDWTVGQLIKALKDEGIYENTLIVFSSDNGPVLDDGYQDGAVTQLNGHRQTGNLRGGKYSVFEGGTSIPFIISWPLTIKPAISGALVSQLDFIASFAKLLGQKVPETDATDSQNTLETFLGTSNTGRNILVEQGDGLAIVKDHWKYIAPNNGAAFLDATGIETGNAKTPQLYDLANDAAEKNNLAGQYPDKVAELAALLKQATYPNTK